MKQRIESIDVIRGISIIGILFMNILGFHYHEVLQCHLTIIRITSASCSTS